MNLYHLNKEKFLEGRKKQVKDLRENLEDFCFNIHVEQLMNIECVGSFSGSAYVRVIFL